MSPILLATMLIGIWNVPMGLTQISGPDGSRVSIWAPNEKLANPVALSLDLESGEAWVAEAHRKLTGVWGVTFSRWWCMEDYVHKTLQDRLDMYARWEHVVPADKMQSVGDILRQLTPTDTGLDSQIWGTPRSQLADGNAAGVLSWNGWTYFACVPNLYRTRQSDGNQVLETIVSGLGVRVGVHGHDLHGIVPGLDGRIYFSMGDRGFDVITGEGKRNNQSHRGAVLRCFPDGSGLEIFHEGLRNPQEIAFNWRGDLFTVDNNMSGGDECRIIHLLEGADSGWQAEYQLARNFREETKKINDPTNPWFFEHLWQTNHVDQPAWVHRPVAHLTRGPSGLTYVPGDIAPPEWQDQFLIADFVGSAANSYILAFKTIPEGAGYKLESTSTFLQGVLATDQTFGPDGALYVADFINGWTGVGQGRIQKLTFPEWSKTDEFARAVSHRSQWNSDDSVNHIDFLASKLEARDLDTRLLAQWKLAELGLDGLNAFHKVLETSDDLTARIHSVYGLGMIARKRPETLPEVQSKIGETLKSGEPELVVHALTVAGDLTLHGLADDIARHLSSTHPRVQYASIMALSRIHPGRDPSIRAEISRMIETVGLDADQGMKNAFVNFFFRQLSGLELASLSEDDSHEIRLAAVLALRKHRSAYLTRFLGDADTGIRLEAARAIHDLRISAAMPSLAHWIQSDDFGNQHPFWQRRVMNANFLLGSPVAYENLTDLVMNPPEGCSTDLINEAVELIEEWENPSPFDNVTWHAHPMRPRPRPPIGKSSTPSLKLAPFSEASERAIRWVLATGSASVDELSSIISVTEVPPNLKTSALRRLAFAPAGDVESATDKVPDGFRDILRLAVMLRMESRDNPLGLKQLADRIWDSSINDHSALIFELMANARNTGARNNLIQTGIIRARQSAEPLPWSARLADFAKSMDSDSISGQLFDWSQELAPDENRPFVGLWNLALDGGDKDQGKWLFINHSAQCVRCHKVDDAGGDAGPDLNLALQGKSTRHILESILYPSKDISPGFGSVSVITNDNAEYTGSFTGRSQDGISIVINDEFGQSNNIQIGATDIRSIEFQPSAMPEMSDQLSISEVRDLVAYLKSIQ